MPLSHNTMYLVQYTMVGLIINLIINRPLEPNSFITQEQCILPAGNLPQWNKHSTYCTILVNTAHPIHQLTVRLTLQDTTENPHTSGPLFQKILLRVDKFPLEYFQPFLGLRCLNFPPVPFFWFLQDTKQFYVIITDSFWLVKVNLIFIQPRRKLF